MSCAWERGGQMLHLWRDDRCCFVDNRFGLVKIQFRTLIEAFGGKALGDKLVAECIGTLVLLQPLPLFQSKFFLLIPLACVCTAL